ncbi:MAG: DUF5662 family protein [Firmicutes bacterium]|nr:DUF5662 family protein [Bacillota bacterium]
MKPWQHFKTITRHRMIVCAGCFRVGLYWRGLTHDLSKYSPTEFWNGAKYYQGIRSPNTAEREDKGYSEAWMHHKGCNRHHYEYWTDLDMETHEYVSVPIPRVYLVEQLMDRRAACIVYQGKDYHDSSALEYFQRGFEQYRLHPKTRREIEFLLTMLAQKGDRETFRYIRTHVLKGKPFPWEEEAPPENQ